jgi:hypothetical protein
MKLFGWAVLASLAGCMTSGSGDDYPVLGVGGGGGGGSSNGSGSGSGSGTVMYKACLLLDTRVLTGCAPTGAGGMMVTLGSASAVTMDDGTFSIDTSTGMGSNFVVTSTNTVTSVLPFGYGSSFGIPVIKTADYTDMQNTMGALPVAGQGAIMVAVFVSGGTPYVGATATTTPAGIYEVFYDGVNPTTWNTGSGGTGTYGTIWAPGIATGPSVMTVYDVGMTTGNGPSGIAVMDGAITFAPVMK